MMKVLLEIKKVCKPVKVKRSKFLGFKKGNTFVFEFNFDESGNSVYSIINMETGEVVSDNIPISPQMDEYFVVEIVGHIERRLS